MGFLKSMAKWLPLIAALTKLGIALVKVLLAIKILIKEALKLFNIA
ncbi:hypothetical protein ACPUEJ_24535 (plasmid) [Vibrio tubiashii]